MLDVVLYDLDGAYCPPGLSAPVGGSEVELYQLADAFNRAGLKCSLVASKKPVLMPAARVLVFWRQVGRLAHYTSERYFVRATDAHGPGFRQAYELTTVCVSRWQASRIATPTIVIPPMLGPHVAERYSYRRGQWIYASAANKGLRETLAAWKANPRSPIPLWITTTGYDDGDAEECAEHGARYLGRLSPLEMVVTMARCQGLYYRNVAPETFGVTTAIAAKLGLELDVECVGHDVCGLVESRVRGRDLSESSTVARWVEALGL